jgi:hypothetical protein
MLRQPRYDNAEFTRRGKELYQTQVRAKVEAGNQGRIVAIDIDTGEFEVGDTVLAASGRLLARLPDAQIWCVRIGEGPVRKFGPAMRRGAKSA